MLLNTKELAILLPGYRKNDGGNITIAYFLKEKTPHILYRPLNGVIHQLKQQGHGNFIFTDKKLQTWTNCRQLLPIPVDINATFFPLHFRTAPQSVHDGCTAYLRLSLAFDGTLDRNKTPDREKVVLNLPSGVVFHAAANWETFWRHATEALHVKNALLLDNFERLNRLTQFMKERN